MPTVPRRFTIATLFLAIALLAALVVPAQAANAQGVGDIVITEFLTANQSGYVDNTGDLEDWIELHNTTDQTIFLTNWSLSDSSTTHVFAGGIIEPGGYLVVVASGDPSRSTFYEPHVPFKLSRSGEELALRDPSGALGSVWAPYPPQIDDVSYGIDNTGAEFFFSPPTPGAPNTGATSGVVADVVFSVPAGFYDLAQQVIVSTPTPGATIRYTTDGSTPSATNGTAVTSGASLTISTTTNLRAVAVRSGWVSSRIETRSYLFVDDIIRQPETPPPGWPGDGGVNGHRISYGMNQAFVEGNESVMEASLLAIPSVSITTDLEHLWDPVTGIYANPLERGSLWERPASVEFIDPTGQQPGFETLAGLRIRGGASRSPNNPKHSLRFVFNTEYEGALDYQFFDDGISSYESITLGTGQHGSFQYGANTYATWIREMWSRDVQGLMGQPYNRSDYVHVYLNGQYWGLYFTQERLSNGLGAEYFGGDSDDYDIITNASYWLDGADARDGTLDAWNSMWPLVKDLSITDAEYASLAEQIDLVNLADHYVIYHYSGDGDSTPARHERFGYGFIGSNNWRALRNRAGEGAAGKWVFYDHDSEGSLCYPYPDPLRLEMDNTTPWNLDKLPLEPGEIPLTPAWLHEALLTHPSYRQIFVDRVAVHMVEPGGLLTVENALAALDPRIATVGSVVDAEVARWGDHRVQPGYDRITWEDAITELQRCTESRHDLVRTQLTADGLWPTMPTPLISPADGTLLWQAPITIDVNATPGTLWVTTDGTDPRGADGTPSATAFVYTGALTLTRDLEVRARVLDGTAWSPMAVGSFDLDSLPDPPSVLVNEFNAVSASRFLGGGDVGDTGNGADATLGRVAGNGGDWFEMVVLADADLRGWSIEVSDIDAGQRARSARLEFGTDPLLGNIVAGTIITVSEDITDDVSFDPAAGDWHINFQANDAGDGAYFTVASQSGFDVNNDDTQIALFDAQGWAESLATGEGTAPNAGVGSTEVFKLEAIPTASIGPDDAAYNDGTSSTWGTANVWAAGTLSQDLSSLRMLVGDPNCDGTVNIADALIISQYTVGLRTDAGGCPLTSPAAELMAPAGDVNSDGSTDIADALIIARCEVGIANDFCPVP